MLLSSQIPVLAIMSSGEEDDPPDSSEPLIEEESESTTGPVCSRCEVPQPADRWINWQKCWSAPMAGVNGEQYCLAYPNALQKPLTLRLHGSASYGDTDFWWFFVCERCRFIMLRGGFSIENTEIRDRWCPGTRRSVSHTRPVFVPRNLAVDIFLDRELGVRNHWRDRSPSSPSSSIGSSNPWHGHF